MEYKYGIPVHGTVLSACASEAGFQLASAGI